MMSFFGYHAEWNLGSPGGWDYARSAQELGRRAWDELVRITGLDIELEMKDPRFDPVAGFKDLLLRANDRVGAPGRLFIAIVAEEETLDAVIENKNIVEKLNRVEGVRAALAAPQQLALKDGKVVLDGQEVSLIFQDFNNATILEVGKKHNLEALLHAIRKGFVVNPRGMEPGGDKGVFEYAGDPGSGLSQTTRERTPWSRKFARRRVTDPEGTMTDDLVEWTRVHWKEVVLKPAHGYSGHGIFVGKLRESTRDQDIAKALEQGNYIVQALVPLDLWAEYFPWIDHETKKVVLKRWQTDFRCFITDKGLMGFVARFGQIPTNVGSGGGVQSLAILKSDVPLEEAVRRIDRAITAVPYERLAALEKEIKEEAIRMGLVYLLGPIPTTLRPRVVTGAQVGALEEYSRNLWTDAVRMEKAISEGKLDHVLSVSSEEMKIAAMQPWNGGPALIAADGLFGFGAPVPEGGKEGPRG
ncbi:MAG: hypothetical protein ABII00_07505 [Elusimicrobiota bacterium]